MSDTAALFEAMARNLTGEPMPMPGWLPGVVHVCRDEPEARHIAEEVPRDHGSVTDQVRALQALHGVTYGQARRMLLSSLGIAT